MTLRLELVGHGRWGQNIERTLLSFPHVSVTNIAKGERPPAELNGVLIATQSATHAANALPYIEAGIATFIEKPMATSVSDAERIRDASKRSGAIVFVGHIFLYHPAFLAALELLPSLGGIHYLLCEAMNNSPRTDSSVLWDWLPHDLSMARAIFGRDPESVNAWSLSGGTKPQAVLSKFQFGDTPVISMISWLSQVRRKRTTVVCEKATLVFDDKADRRLVLYNKQDKLTYPAYSDEPPLTRELSAFLQAVQSGTADAPHIEIGFGIVRSIVAANESLDFGGRSIII